MKSIAGVLALLVVLGVVGFVALHQLRTQGPAGAASGVPPGGGAAAAAAMAQQRATEDVRRAFDAASAARDAAEPR